MNNLSALSDWKDGLGFMQDVESPYIHSAGQSHNENGIFTVACVHPADPLIAVGNNYGVVDFYGFYDESLALEFEYVLPEPQSISAISFNNDWLILGTSKGEIIQVAMDTIQDTPAKSKQHKFTLRPSGRRSMKMPHSNRVRAVAVSDTEAVGYATVGGGLYTWQCDDPMSIVNAVPSNSQDTYTCLDLGFNALLGGTYEGECHLYDTNNLTTSVCDPLIHPAAVTAASWNKNCSWLFATGCADGYVRIYDTRHISRPYYTLEFDSAVMGVDWSPLHYDIIGTFTSQGNAFFHNITAEPESLMHTQSVDIFDTQGGFAFLNSQWEEDLDAPFSTSIAVTSGDGSVRVASLPTSSLSAACQYDAPLDLLYSGQVGSFIDATVDRCVSYLTRPNVNYKRAYDVLLKARNTMTHIEIKEEDIVNMKVKELLRSVSSHLAPLYPNLSDKRSTVGISMDLLIAMVDTITARDVDRELFEIQDEVLSVLIEHLNSGILRGYECPMNLFCDWLSQFMRFDFKRAVDFGLQLFPQFIQTDLRNAQDFVTLVFTLLSPTILAPSGAALGKCMGPMPEELEKIGFVNHQLELLNRLLEYENNTEMIITYTNSRFKNDDIMVSFEACRIYFGALIDAGRWLQLLRNVSHISLVVKTNLGASRTSCLLDFTRGVMDNELTEMIKKQIENLERPTDTIIDDFTELLDILLSNSLFTETLVNALSDLVTCYFTQILVLWQQNELLDISSIFSFFNSEEIIADYDVFPFKASLYEVILRNYGCFSLIALLNAFQTCTNENQYFLTNMRESMTIKRFNSFFCAQSPMFVTKMLFQVREAFEMENAEAKRVLSAFFSEIVYKLGFLDFDEEQLCAFSHELQTYLANVDEAKSCAKRMGSAMWSMIVENQVDDELIQRSNHPAIRVVVDFF
ncbi:hypothetical protein PCE1_004134 [Barthelona sp. PCE]